LLGDVLYNEKLISRMLDAPTPRPASFFGNSGELWGCSFSDRGGVENALRKVIKSPVKGKLWHVYRGYCGIPLDTHRFDDQGIFVSYHDGFVQDFDFIERYRSWLKLRQKEV
jgi:hypothetical protein